MDDRQRAIDFLALVTTGRVREAYEKHVGAGFVHHNPYFRGDARSLMMGMIESDSNFPERSYELLRSVGEAGLVMTHSRVRMKPADLGISVVHIFRFEDGKIVEFWDIGQGVPADMQNEKGMF